MSKNIHSLPENIDEAFGFEPKFKKLGSLFDSYTPKIRTLNNAFVNHYGLVIYKQRLAYGCAFNIKGKDDKNFLVAYWRQAYEQYLVCRFGKSLPSIVLKEDIPVLLIHSKWFNYAFWTTSFLLRLIMAEDAGILRKACLLFPEHWHNIPYVMQSLSLFEFTPLVIPEDHHVFAAQLYMPQTRQYTASYDSIHIQKIQDRIVPAVLKHVATPSFPKKVYITRKKRGLRSVANENELEKVLSRYGYTIIDFEDFSFFEQVALMHTADAFISLHGAGFANIQFMKPKSIVLELVNEVYAKMEYTFPFWKLANACGHKYLFQLCPVSNLKTLKTGFGKRPTDRAEDFLVYQNVSVDVKEFERNLERIESLLNSV